MKKHRMLKSLLTALAVGSVLTGFGTAYAGTVRAPVPSTPTRPQLSAAEAARNTLLQHFEFSGSLSAGLTRNPWDPRAGMDDLSDNTPTYSVTPGTGPFPTVSAAITAATLLGGTARVYIRVEPGTYREVVCVPVGAPPITLYGAAKDPARTVIVFNNFQTKPKVVGQPASQCTPNLAAAVFGTSGAATFTVSAPDFHARNITFANDFDEGTLTMGTQAPALMTAGDRALFENVRVLGNHDTLYTKTLAVDTVARAYFRNCYVEGDEDFIQGRATMALDHCTIHYLSSRRGVNNSGWQIVPSTDVRNEHGMLIMNSAFTAQPGTPANSVFLGRAWDEAQVDLPTYKANVLTGIFPNGKAVIRDSYLGPHIMTIAPWAASAIVARPYSSVATPDTPANRLFEFNNTGPGRGAM